MQADLAAPLVGDQEVGFCDGIRLVVQFLAEHKDLYTGVDLLDMLARDREHTARSASRVEDTPHNALAFEFVLVFGKEQVDHQPDYFPGRIVLAGGFIRHFRESTEKLLENIAHFVVRYRLRVEVHLGEPVADHIQQIVLRQLIGDGIHLEVLDDLPDVLRKTVEVGIEVDLDVAGVLCQTFEVEVGYVIKIQAARRVQHDLFQLERFEYRLIPFVFLDDFVFAVFEDAVEPAEDDKRQRDIAVLVGLERAAKDVVGDGPDEVSFVLEVGHRFGIS